MCIISLDTENLVITESDKTCADKFVTYGFIEYKCRAEKKRFGNIMQRDDQKGDMFKVINWMVKTNQDIEEQCIKSDDGVLAVSDEGKKIASKSYYWKLLNVELAWDKNILSLADAVSGVPCSISKDMVRESVSKMKNGKAILMLGHVNVSKIFLKTF